MARVLFNDLPESVKSDLIRKYMGNASADDKELQKMYTDIFSKDNYAIGGFSDDFIKKNNLKPYTRMLYPGQLNRLQKIKDAYKTGEITNQDDFLAKLKDFISDEAPEVYDEKNAEETDALRQFENEVYAGTPWGTVDSNKKSILFNNLPDANYDINKDYGDMSSVDDETADWINDMITASEDINNDGDTDLQIADTSGDGKPDTAIITADSKAEEKEAAKAAKEKLGLDNKDKTSTGKTKGELSGSETLSDWRQKRIAKMHDSWGPTKTQKDIAKARSHKSDCTCSLCKKYHLNGYSSNGVGTVSDMRQKNILSALIDRRF